MAYLITGDVAASVAALLDDPGQTDIDFDYVIPFINLRWANLVVNMAALGLQYGEEVVIFDVPAGTVSLAKFMLSGGVLQGMMEPRAIEWKIQGADDTTYAESDSVEELDDYEQGAVGCPQYSWQGGTVLLVPSSVPITMRMRFIAMSTNLIDPTDSMVRGVGDILAYRAAEIIYSIRGNAPMALKCQAWGDTALDDFLAMSIMRSQTSLTILPPTHRRLLGGFGGNFIAR